MGNCLWKWCPQNVGYFVSGSQRFNPEGQVSVPYWFLTWWERPPGCMGRLAWPEGCVNSLRPEKMGNIFRIFLNQIFHIFIEMFLKFIVKVTIQVKACCWTSDNVSLAQWCPWSIWYYMLTVGQGYNSGESLLLNKWQCIPGPVVPMIHMILYVDSRPQWVDPAHAELFCEHKGMYLYFIWLFLTEITLVCGKHGSTLLTYIAKTLLKLTHCGLVMPYDDWDLGEHWLR